MSWGPWQREVLDALGFEVCQMRAAAAVHGDAAAADRRDAMPSPAGDRLLHALLRAAAREPGDPEVAALVGHGPQTAALRGDPAAKRALWPRLRALRAATARRT